ncbi:MULTISPECIES: hypothetical protein [Cyanophyceae]|uniref:hypothetical protein n=1 Tax=Cyanophyceae TaxID=3028117 RepID=UPI001684F205|nr:hypothetical protein [Trichocoleus sp. FACHB-40]MBD2006879.1 hypothetical protein [Trichocoleus sp. FACHB-40]
MSQTKTIGLRLAPHVAEKLDRLCQLRGQSRVELVTDLIMGVNRESGVNTAKTLQAKDVNKSVCVIAVGTKLPSTWDIKADEGERKGLREKIFGKLWYVFPEDRVVAVKKKSANGTQQWLEVAKVYPDEVWDEAESELRKCRVYSPVTTLETCLSEYQAGLAYESNPIVIEAKQKGFKLEDPRQAFRYGLEKMVEAADRYLTFASNPTFIEASNKGFILNGNSCFWQPYHILLAKAERYLAQLEVIPVITEVHSAGSEMPPVLSDDTRTPEQTEVSPEHLRLTMEELAKRLATHDTAKAIRAMVNTLTTIGAKPLGKGWTKKIDPDQLVWLPVDDTREEWVAKRP